MGESRGGDSDRGVEAGDEAQEDDVDDDGVDSGDDVGDITSPLLFKLGYSGISFMT